MWVDVARLEYALNESDLSNGFEDEDSPFELPSVSYLENTFGAEAGIPLSLFNSNMTPLQVVIKYAKEKVGLSNVKIASLIGRDPQTVWITYRAVRNKRFSQEDLGGLLIPFSIFKDESLSALECLVSFLKEKEFSYAQMGRLIGRDQRTVWTAWSRARKKLRLRGQDE